MTSFYGGGVASTSGGDGSSAKGALIFKGTLGISDDGATVLALPDMHEEGWTYLVVTAGTYAGQLCEKGDFVICVSSGESASDLDWTVVQGNTFNTLPTPTASDEGKIIAVDALGNYILIDKPSSGGGTENLPDPSEADEGKILSVGADGNYTLIDNPVDSKLDKNNGTATGTTTFDKAQANRLELLVDGESIGGFRSIDLTPAVTDDGDDSSMRFVPLFIGEPTKNAHAATKKYVDDKAGNYLPLAGGTMTGSIDAGENTVTNLKEPENGTDATTKNYVDGEVAKAAPISIMPISEVEGQNLITVNDSVEWPLQGLRVYGKSTQVTTTGAQLIDTQAWQTADSEYYKVAEDGGMIQLKEDGRSATDVPAFLELEAGDYIASINAGFILQVIKDGADLVVVVDGNSTTFTLDAPATLTMKVYEHPSTNNYPSPVAYPMINTGSTVKPWEPYTGGKPSPSPEYPQPIMSAGDGGSIGLTVSDGADQSQQLTVITPNGLPGIPVDSGGNYTDASEQQWVCDYKDYKNEAYIKNLTLIPDLSIGTFTKHADGMFICNLASYSAPIANSKVLASMCTHFPSVNSQNLFGIVVSVQYIIIGTAFAETFGSVDDFNNFLLEQRENNTPVQLLYYQNETTETPLSAEEVAAYRALHTYDGATVVSTTEDVAGIEARYIADIAKIQTGKLDKANPTYTGSLTGENAAFSGTVTVATPAAEGEAANKGYVDAAKIELEGDINTLQQTVANQAETINTLNQQVTNITGGTAELPYLKNTGDSGTGIYDFTGATVNAADPVDNSNVATKHYVDQKVASSGSPGGVVSYTQGDGISISPENEISLSIDSAGANGLKVGANGLGLDLATGTTSGAMAASDKIAIASNTTEITNIKDGTTELPYLKETNPTYEGTLIGGDATFTGSVQISTPDQDNEAANKGYVDTALAEAKSYTDNAVSGIASDETIQQIQSDIENIEDGTTVLPYLSSAGGTVTGPIKYGTSPKDTSDLANKAYVDAIHVQAVADAKNYTDSEITNLENGTTELPYIKNNGDTITGSYDLTGAEVTIAEPVSDNSPATKKYVDDAISAIDVSEQIAPLTERVAAAEGEIDTLQTDIEAVETSVTNITNGTTELPYVKDSGDTVTGTYNFTGANVTIAEPTVSNNPATKNYVDTKIASAGGSGEVVSYTQGNGINISPENIISVVIAADNANGLAVDTSGIKLNVATSTTAGAMSAVDKAKLDASSTTEQMNQAISSAIDETLEDPTKLPFVNINGDTMHGSLTTTELFTDFVTIRNAGTDGSTGFQNNSDTDHIRVYDKVANTLVPIEVGEPVNNQDASTKKYVDNKITAETAARAEAIESLDEAKADKDNPTFTGIISGANATLSGTLTGNTATFSGGITVPLAPGAEGSATSKKYVDDQIAAINISEQIEPLTQRVTTAEGEIDTLQSDMTTVKSNVGTINTNITNITNGTTKLPYITKEEVEIAADTRDVARAYRYTFNESLGGTNSNAGFGFINFTPAIVTEKDGSTDFSPLYIGEPEKESQAATKKYVDDAIAAVDAPEYTLAKQTAAEDGYFATYYLTKDNVQVGEKINIPKDYLVKEAELLEVAVTDTPYSGAVIGDKYIDFTINTQASDEDEQHIYLPVKDLVDVYTSGNGINIDASNIVSVQIDAANSNGLALGSAGLKLNLATTSAAGAMSAADKTKLDTAISEEQLTAVENKVDTLQTEVNNIKSGTTDLGYLKTTDPTYTGTLNGINATFTGDVIVPTPDGDTEAANKQYVDSAIDTAETALTEDINEVQQSVMQQTGTIDILSQTLSAITQGTMALPYIKNTGDTVEGDYTFSGKVNINQPTDNANATNKEYVDTKDTALDQKISKIVDGTTSLGYIKNTGGTATGAYDFTGATMKVASPSEDANAATKGYVDGEVAKAVNDKIDAVYNSLYNSLVKKAETVDEVNQLFKDWWNANWKEGSSTYNDMLERWFGKVLDDDKVYGVKLPLFETSTSPQGEYIEDSIGAIITPATEEDPGQNDFAKTPQFWCVEVAAEKNADGSHTIYACEFIDDIDVVRNGGPDNGKHLVWVLQKNTYVREYEESGYSYIKIQCHPADGFVQWPQGTDRTGHTYSYMANPKYAAGIDDEGNIGGRTGLKPTSYMSMNQTIQAWRARGPQYSGSSACFYKWAYIMFALLTAKKGEDVGCNNYNLQYAAAVSESGVSRIILTADQANNLYVGSNVIVGNTKGSDDRNYATMYSLVNQKRISSIEEVIIGEDASSYKAIYIDVPEGTTFDTIAGTTYISTMPFYSGWTDTVKGTIGVRYGTNLNKQPYLLQKVELMNGAYNYASDELDEWSQQDDTHYLYSYYLCEDQTKVSTNGTITDDYVKKENATMTIDIFVYSNYRQYYIEDNLADNNFKMLNPKKFSTSAGSGTGTRDAFYLGYAASGVRMPNVWAHLWDGGNAGLSCRLSYGDPSVARWLYAGGCPGLSG